VFESDTRISPIFELTPQPTDATEYGTS